MDNWEKAVCIACATFIPILVFGLVNESQTPPNYDSPQRVRMDGVAFEVLGAIKQDELPYEGGIYDSDLIIVRVQVDNGHIDSDGVYRPNFKLIDGQQQLYGQSGVNYEQVDARLSRSGSGVYTYQFVVPEESRLSDYKLVVYEGIRTPAYLELVS